MDQKDSPRPEDVLLSPSGRPHFGDPAQCLLKEGGKHPAGTGDFLGSPQIHSLVTKRQGFYPSLLVNPAHHPPPTHTNFTTSPCCISSSLHLSFKSISTTCASQVGLYRHQIVLQGKMGAPRKGKSACGQSRLSPSLCTKSTIQ